MIVVGSDEIREAVVWWLAYKGLVERGRPHLVTFSVAWMGNDADPVRAEVRPTESA